MMLFVFVLAVIIISIISIVTLYVCCLLFRFAQFFIGPLMSADATMREIKAVDSG